jgi:hypothetical protein
MFLNFVKHLHKGKSTPPCKRHTFLMRGIKEHCAERFLTIHNYVQTNNVRMWHGSKYIQQNLGFPDVTQNMSTRSDPVCEMTFILPLPWYAQSSLNCHHSVAGFPPFSAIGKFINIFVAQVNNILNHYFFHTSHGQSRQKVL